MDEISFRCPPYLAQRFWLLCNELGETPGALLRAFMIDEIKSVDGTFSMDMKDVTGLEEDEVRTGSAPNIIRRRRG